MSSHTASIERDSSSQQHSEEDTYKSVERTNLLNMSKLAIKGLIESAMKDGKILDDSHLKLQQLCIVLEYVVDHRLKGVVSGISMVGYASVFVFHMVLCQSYKLALLLLCAILFPCSRCGGEEPGTW